VRSAQRFLDAEALAAGLLAVSRGARAIACRRGAVGCRMVAQRKELAGDGGIELGDRLLERPGAFVAPAGPLVSLGRVGIAGASGRIAVVGRSASPDVRGVPLA
jgi:hypothetical protein